MSLTKITDDEIVSLVLSGDKEQFEILIKRYNQQLFRVGVGYLKSEGDAQDAMQSTFLKVYEKLSQFRSESSFSTWIVRIMINECLLLIRRKKKTSSDPLDETLFQSYESNGAQQLINKEMKDIFEKAIIDLPEKYRAIYMFRAINCFSTKETANYLDISQENVKVRYFRAKQLLKEQLLKSVGSKEVFTFLGERCDKMTQTVMSIILNKPLLS